MYTSPLSLKKYKPIRNVYSNAKAKLSRVFALSFGLFFFLHFHNVLSLAYNPCVFNGRRLLHSVYYFEHVLWYCTLIPKTNFPRLCILLMIFLTSLAPILREITIAGS